MAKQAAKRAAPSPLTTALSTASLNFRFGAGDLDWESLHSFLVKDASALVSDEGRSLWVAVQESGELSEFHAHVSIDKEDDGGVVVRYEIVGGHAGAHAEKLIGEKRFFSRLAAALRNPKATHVAVGSATHVFDMSEWSSTFPLPFSAPAVTDAVPGRPQISGLDFYFGEEGSSQPLVRAFVTTYPEWRDVLLRLALRYEAPIASGVGARFVAAAQVHVPTFVRATGGEP